MSDIDPDTLKQQARDAAKWRAYVAQARESGKKASKPVRCLDTGEVFPSGVEAARAYGTTAQAISRCVVGRQFTTGGKRWELVKPTPQDLERQTRHS